MKKSIILITLIFLISIGFSDSVSAGAMGVVNSRELNATDNFYYRCDTNENNGTFAVLRPDNITDYFYKDVPCPFENDFNDTYQYDIEGVYIFWYCHQPNCWINSGTWIDGYGNRVIVTEEVYQQENAQLREDLDELQSNFDIWVDKLTRWHNEMKQSLNELNKFFKNAFFNCPSDMVKVGDFCIDEVLNPSNSWWDANQICSDEDKRMCQPSEWHEACNLNNSQISQIGQVSEWMDGFEYNHNAPTCRLLMGQTGSSGFLPGRCCLDSTIS